MRNIDYSFITHSKNQNLEKESTFIHHNNLFVVIDGVGRDYLRTKAANLAYSVIMETFFRVLEENNSPGDAIFSSLQKANRAILEERIKISEKMAASVCVLYIEGRIMYFSHLGDARIYSFQDNEINQLTRDHTLREEDPFAEKRYDDPRALQALIKGVGIHEVPDIYIKKYPLEKKGMILLTTERLTERISNRDIQWLSSKVSNPKKLLKSIVELYTRKGGDEGFTLGLVRYGVFPKWLRKVLSIYLVFFLILITVVGGYFIIYSNNEVPEEDAVVSNPVISENHSNIQPQQKTVDVSRTEERTVVRQSIITDKEIAAPAEKTTALKPESIDDIYGQVHTLLTDWTNAWEMSAGDNGDISDYISFYSGDFRSGRLNKNGWASDKSKKNRRKKWIKVEISNIRISNPDRNNMIKVRFSQDYKSSNFSVVSEKVLLLKKENSKWVIASEKSS